MKIVGTVAAMLAGVGINAWSVPLFGEPLTVVGMAVLGASLGAAYGKPLEKRRDLFITVLGHAFLAAVLIAVFPAAFAWEWVTATLKPPLAGLVAFVAKFALPIIPWGELIRKVFRLEPKRDNDDKEL